MASGALKDQSSGDIKINQEQILQNLQQIQTLIQKFEDQFEAINPKLEHTNTKIDQVSQIITEFQSTFQRFETRLDTMNQSIQNLEEKSDEYNKRFVFMSDKFTTLLKQIDQLDTDFGSLKTMVLAAVDKAMKEYSNFVVEKLTLGSTIDTLRIELDKLKLRIEKLEYEV